MKHFHHKKPTIRYLTPLIGSLALMGSSYIMENVITVLKIAGDH